MALFLVVALQSSDHVIEAAITAKIVQKDDIYRLESGKWIVDVGVATSKDLSDFLGITLTATHFVVPVRGYFGRAQPDLWEWLAAKSVKANG